MWKRYKYPSAEKTKGHGHAWKPIRGSQSHRDSNQRGPQDKHSSELGLFQICERSACCTPTGSASDGFVVCQERVRVNSRYRYDLASFHTRILGRGRCVLEDKSGEGVCVTVSRKRERRGRLEGVCDGKISRINCRARVFWGEVHSAVYVRA